jgi:hypothetical protein
MSTTTTVDKLHQLLGLTSTLLPCPRSVDMLQISGADDDASFWRDVDHEGVGAQSLACVHVTRGRR